MASMKSLFVVAVFLYVGNSLVLAENTDSTCSNGWPPRKQNGTSGSITTRSFPHKYGYNQECHWWIATPVNKKLEISFETFNLQPSSTSSTRNCNDYIKINGNYYCGSTAPPTLYYTGNVFIEFVSDNHLNYKGFKLIWRILKVDSRLCSKTPIIQNGTSGHMTSPNFPDSYYNRLSCSWRIITPENTLVEISFDSNFDIQPKYNGRCYDELMIKRINKYCGETAPGKRLYTGNITIQFTSSSYRNYLRFKLSWRFVRVKVWQVIVFTGRTGIITLTVRIGFGETGSDVTYFHLGTEFEAGSNKTHKLLLPVKITNPKPPGKLMLKSAWSTNWRVIQVALVGVIDGNNVVYMHNCSKSHTYTNTQTCNYHSEIHRPGPSTVTQVIETTSTSRPSTVTQVTITTSTSSVVSEPDVDYECSVGASARIGRRTVAPPAPSTPAAPAVPPAAGVGFIEEVENVEDDDFTAGSVNIEDIGEDGTIYARLDNVSRPDPARLQPITSRGRTAPRVILGAEEDVGLYGELDFSRPAIPLTELNNH
ncbi:uncharacterized protein LOC141909485 isoform X2 [Tubulanus polymorphus]|uniref:uncharacterized protein LOC141909485 isoform X2 n=1 Tax=Tubulanus polymorphus TaxID=672921 RepID=UPI003DA60DE1